jgi:hypothetical protein
MKYQIIKRVSGETWKLIGVSFNQSELKNMEFLISKVFPLHSKAEFQIIPIAG